MQKMKHLWLFSKANNEDALAYYHWPLTQETIRNAEIIIKYLVFIIKYQVFTKYQVFIRYQVLPRVWIKLNASDRRTLFV